MRKRLEKALKSYAWVLGEQSRMTHRAYTLLDVWLERGRERLRYPDHFSHLSRMFGLEARERLQRILDLTPGATGQTDAPNTEYPWHDASGELCVPATSRFFEFPPEKLREDLRFVESVVGLFEKLARAAARGRL